MADGGFPLRQAIKDGAAGGIGKRVEDMIEFCSTIWLSVSAPELMLNHLVK